MVDTHDSSRPDSYAPSSDEAELTPYQQAMLDANPMSPQLTSAAMGESGYQQGAPGPSQAVPSPYSENPYGTEPAGQSLPGQDAAAGSYSGQPLYPGGRAQDYDQGEMGGPAIQGGQQIPTSMMHEPVPLAPVPFFKQETLASWVVTLLLMSFVPFFLWHFFLAFSDVGSEAKKQFARAQLVILAGVFVLGILFLILVVMTAN